ncbi:endonuclease [Neokomagataea thailandica NBRC 106555]|uniref:Endonuclease n=1 Tax=Neokomagataea thailandica NBRC 106555 TaxID=1223520 RepID=A0ABQ0QPI2_9PROT|nr:endonuclease [Neokomagataea thailandica NBRC 106555]
MLSGVLLCTVQVATADEQCAALFFKGQLPRDLQSGDWGQQAFLCNAEYAAMVSSRTKSPLWSAEDLTAENVEAARNTNRINDSREDPRLTRGMRATLQDYRDVGYDRGHMTPSGDEPGAEAQDQSFFLSNIVPQTAELNRGPWEGVESAVRGWAEQEGELFVVTGPGYDPDHLAATVGIHSIPVPDVIWKAVYDPAGPGAGVYICTNTHKPQCKITSVATLTQLVGIDPFPALSESLKNQVSSMPPIRESPHAVKSRTGSEKLLNEWGSKMAQKALKALLHALSRG